MPALEKQAAVEEDPIRGPQRGRRCESRLLSGLQESTKDGGVANPPAVEKHQWSSLQQKAQKAVAQGGDSLLRFSGV